MTPEPTASPPATHASTLPSTRGERRLLRSALAVSLLLHSGAWAWLELRAPEPPARPTPLVHIRLVPSRPARPPVEPFERRIEPAPLDAEPPARAALRPRRVDVPRAPGPDDGPRALPVDAAAAGPLARPLAARPDAPPPAPAPRDALPPRALLVVTLAAAQVVSAHALDASVNAPPEYPALARRRGWEGDVVLLVEVLADGSAGEVVVAESSGHAMLDEAALDAARAWRYEPARRDGRAIPSTYRQPFVFRLDG